MAGTRLGRQELDGELIEDVEGALWTARRCSSGGRASAHERRSPLLARVVVGVDPPASAEGDACGIVGVRARRGRDRLCARRSAARRGCRPRAGRGRWRAAAERWGADRVVAEENQGGDMVESVLRASMPACRCRLVQRQPRQGGAGRAGRGLVRDRAGEAGRALSGARGRAVRADARRRLCRGRGGRPTGRTRWSGRGRADRAAPADAQGQGAVAGGVGRAGGAARSGAAPASDPVSALALLLRPARPLPAPAVLAALLRRERTTAAAATAATAAPAAIAALGLLRARSATLPAALAAPSACALGGAAGLAGRALHQALLLRFGLGRRGPALGMASLGMLDIFLLRRS